jgi:hypothetical protein
LKEKTEERFLSTQTDHLAGARWKKESDCFGRNDRLAGGRGGLRDGAITPGSLHCVVCPAEGAGRTASVGMTGIGAESDADGIEKCGRRSQMGTAVPWPYQGSPKSHEVSCPYILSREVGAAVYKVGSRGS